jgi:hypothetical protein
LLPLPPHRRWREDEDAPDAPTEQQLLDDEPRLDGFAEADVVGEQERDAGFTERAEEREKLKVVDLHGAEER